MNELMFSKRCFDAARRTATGDAALARRVSGRKRKPCVGKAWTVGGLVQPRTGRAGELIGSQPCVETVRWSCAGWILGRQERSAMWITSCQQGSSGDLGLGTQIAGRTSSASVGHATGT